MNDPNRDPKLDALRQMGRERREQAAQADPAVQRGLEQAKKGELTDGLSLDRRSGDERRGDVRRVEDVTALATDATLMNELRGLAATARQCQRNGHPDLSKHLEALLTKLGV